MSYHSNGLHQHAPIVKQPDHSPCPTPKRAVQGFVLYLLATASFLLYLLWLVTPEETLESWGIFFLPQRYWAVAIPIYVSVTFVTFVFVVYPSLGLLTTPPLQTGDLRYVLDSNSVFNEDSFLADSQARAEIHKGEIPKVCDIHPTHLVQVLESPQ